jgi:hypothetical protein
MSSHFARAMASEARTFRKSAGTLCTAPGEIAFLLMNFILRRQLPPIFFALVFPHVNVARTECKRRIFLSDGFETS